MTSALSRVQEQLPRLIFWAVAVGVASLRVYYCCLMPANTGDLVRHLAYGVLVGQVGLSAAARPLRAMAPGYGFVSWSRRPYSYPLVPLLFFTGVALVSPTLVYAKLALTAVEAANALLLARLCGNRLWGLVYWCSPLSIWWVSHEGQFEPLQNLLCLLSLWALARRRPAVSGAALALGIQTKVTAVALLPHAVVRALGVGSGGGDAPRAIDRRALLGLGAGLLLGCLPTLIAYPWFPSVEQVLQHGAPMYYNPYYFNPVDEAIFLWHPAWLKAINLAASTGLLILLVVGCGRTRDWAGFCAAILFALALKLHTNVQFWYLLLLPAFLVTIRDRRWRGALLLALPLLDVRAAGQMIVGPFGFVERRFPEQLHAFSSIAELARGKK